MAYSKQTWDTNSIFNPTRMNHIEDGIESIDMTGKFGIVEINVPADTQAHAFNLPTGFRTGLTMLLGALCYTKYSSYVDKDYANGDYFGEVNFISGDRFNYTPYKAGNSTSIRFLFYKIS